MSLARDIVPGRHRPGTFSRLAAWWGPHPTLQAVAIAGLIVVAWLLADNMFATMNRIGVTPGFDFLGRPANFEIGEKSIAFQAGDPYARAILVGLLNTVKVAVLGCVLATMLGVILGVAGLSGNLLLVGLVRWYVEIVRNTPLLLQLFFWIALAKSFPAPRQAISAFDAFYLTNRGVYVPGLVWLGGPASAVVAAGALLAALATLLVILRRRGRLKGRWLALAALGALIAVVLLLAASGVRIGSQTPKLSGFNIRGGYNLTPEFAALLTGLVVKFSAAVAEIVRAGIQSVDRGQWEAARALGLHGGQIMRLIVLPQALRVITPLTTSTYLDLTKDSSLAVAIGYPDLVSIINTTANTTGQSFEALVILISIYLALNLSVSASMNVYNRRVALRSTERR
ncbi:ABC transporter permease subunit [Mesorhizobium sp. BAC0120]|uniref:amino acid ABC transporter permease n=1 Tax=Mesorhizobium sp. BAC0120 TaxID=3090670 RepID=UPI00298BDCEC|nr:ABC transporter permease subunit [Mesorhizobium sp. BAC0120]MDW6020623.1 ABC transporter permease subunit [Mesorhizobium sp. BAC0120]